MTERVGGDRAGRVLAVAIGVLVVLAVVAGVLAAVRPSPQLPEGSPEATVQDYLRLLDADDLEGAAALLDPQGGCSAADLEERQIDPETRVVLRGSTVTDDEATVRVDLVHAASGPFGGEWESEETFDLVRDGGSWSITDGPWALYSCEPTPEPRP